LSDTKHHRRYYLCRTVIDYVIEPLASTVGVEGARYDPISTHDWQRHFMKEDVLATAT